MRWGKRAKDWNGRQGGSRTSERARQKVLRSDIILASSAAAEASKRGLRNDQAVEAEVAVTTVGVKAVEERYRRR